MFENGILDWKAKVIGIGDGGGLLVEDCCGDIYAIYPENGQICKVDGPVVVDNPVVVELVVQKIY